MKYITYKSKYVSQGIPEFIDKGSKRFETFKKHTILVPETDKALIKKIESIMEREKIGGERTIFTPEEFIEMTTPENAYYEHKTEGKIPLKTVSDMITFAIEKGFKAEPLITVKKSNVEQGTTFTGNQIKQ